MTALIKPLAGGIALATLLISVSSAETVEDADAFPSVKVENTFRPAGESNVRSSIGLGHGAGLIGTEESGHIYKTTDGGMNWRQVLDGEGEWDIADVRNFIRGQDGAIYITTTEPALVGRSRDEGESWEIVYKAPASRTVGLVQLDDGTILVGLRRSENGLTSIIRTKDYFDTVDWIPLSKTAKRQNVTSFGYWGGKTVLAGIGFEGSGKIYKSLDGGLSWNKMAEFPEARDIMGFFKAEDDIFALASGISTLFKSSDGGNTWEKSKQFWKKGFLGECVLIEKDGQSYWILSATDQSDAIYRHLVLISLDNGKSWKEWIDLAEEKKGKVKGPKETGGGASNLSVLSDDTIVVGVGNHAVQGRAYTLKLHPDCSP